MACEPCACRSQCGQIAALTPALAAVRFTIPCTARAVSRPPLRLANTGSFAPASPRSVRQRSADDLRQEHLARLLTLAQDGELHQVVLSEQHIRPGQIDDLADTQPAGMGNLDQDAIA